MFPLAAHEWYHHEQQEQGGQYQVADPHAGDHAPEPLAAPGHPLRPRLDAMDDHRNDHERYHGIGGDTERQQPDEGRSGDSLDGALINRLDPWRHPSRGPRIRARSIGSGKLLETAVARRSLKHLPAGRVLHEDSNAEPVSTPGSVQR